MTVAMAVTIMLARAARNGQAEDFLLRQRARARAERATPLARLQTWWTRLRHP
jgi:hypothetical protein